MVQGHGAGSARQQGHPAAHSAYREDDQGWTAVSGRLHRIVVCLCYWLPFLSILLVLRNPDVCWSPLVGVACTIIWRRKAQAWDVHDD